MRAPAFWVRDGFWPNLLGPAAMLYSLAGRLRRAAASGYRAGIPVICVGNATVGGAGKTPVVQALVQQLIENGQRPGILSRGHGGRSRGPLAVDPARHDAVQVGDEPLLHARLAPTVIARDRAAGARLLESLEVDVIVMDDGLQNPAIRPDAALLVVDGATGFGNRRVLPAGPLREPLDDALARVDAIALIGEDRCGLTAGLPTRLPLLRGQVEPTAGAERLRGRRVLAFAGIARPEKLFETLAELGAEVVESHGFDDHHRYRAEEVMALVERAAALQALPVTTVKDAVRLPPDARPMVDMLSVRLIWQEPDRVAEVLRRALARRLPGAANTRPEP